MPDDRRARCFGWLVHLYTASGALVGFFALRAVLEERYREAFFWMIVAVAIDGTDGALARGIRVQQVIPEFDGTKLDDIVDYFTYVVVPAALLYRSGRLSAGGEWIAGAILLSSAYGFCRSDAKVGFYFSGFPSYWNVVALYLYAANLAPAANGGILLALSALVFAPIRFPNLSRIPKGRALTYVLLGVWAAMLLVLVGEVSAAPRRLLAVSLFFPIYYVGLTFWLGGRVI